MEEERDWINVTHYVNPHMFWFKYETSCVTNTELFMWENQLQTHFFKLSRSPPSAYQPQVDEIIAVFIFSFNRWIRAKCDFVAETATTRKYSVWAIDYGVPFQVEDRWIRKLPPDLEEGPRPSVFFAGLLNVVPAQKTFNLEKLETEIVPCDKWSPVAISTIGKLIKETSEIQFVRNKRTKQGQFLGNLVFTTQSKKTIKADVILLEMDQAKLLTTPEFFKVLDEIGTNRFPRWLPNDDLASPVIKSRIEDSHTFNKTKPDDVESFSKLKIALENSDTEIDVERKCMDWEKRNEKYLLQGEISIDDISFNDSVSVQHLGKISDDGRKVKKIESADETEDPPVMMKAGALRRQCLNKYHHNIPPPPSEKNVSSKNSNSVPDSLEKEHSTPTSQKETNSDRNVIESSCSPKSPENVSNAVNVVMSRLANKRKTLRTKLENEVDKSDKANVEYVKMENAGSSEMSNIRNDSFNKDDNFQSRSLSTSNDANVLTPSCNDQGKVKAENHNTQKAVASESTSPGSSSYGENKNRYDKKQQEKTVIPAGFDLRNLSQSHSINHGRKTTSPEKPSDCKDGERVGQHTMNKKNRSPPKNNQQSSENNVRKSGSRQKRSYSEANKISLNSLDEQCLQANLSKHLVLVHGKHIAKPIDKFANANFCDEVHQELEHMRLTQIYRIQSYTWPHIMRGNSSVVVNSARTGRTMSYLPAICSLIKVESDEGLVPDTVGPIGIIMAPSSVEVERIGKLCRRFLQGSATKIGIVESHGVRNIEKTTRYLLNSCEVLIATPSSLCRLIRNKLKLFDSKRLKHLIIDNIDLMHEKMKNEMHEVLRFCCGAKPTTSVQLVVIANYWTPILSGFLKMGNNTQLCIGAYIEAAVYARSLISMKFIAKKTKTHAIIEFMKEHPYLTERLIIVCNKDEETEEVLDVLKSHSCFYVACCSRSTANEIELANEWHHRQLGDMCVLVCTDDVLPELKISGAQNIIHYSLPQSWTRFSFRFSTLFNQFNDLIKSNVPSKALPACLILLDESNNSQLPKLINFLQIHHVENTPKEIYALCNKIRIKREEERISENREFCPYIMEFGKCANSDDCSFRHELTKFDIPQDSQLVSGKIHFKVLSVLSPTYYTVRLLEHQAEGSKTWTKVKCSNEYLKFNLTFAHHFSNHDNHQMHWPIEVGDMCVVSEAEIFHRGKVLYVAKSKSKNLITDVTCRVKLVDTGRVTTCKSSRVLYLPEEFQKFPHQAINLRLSGVVPYDHEQDWSSNAIDTVNYWFRKYITDKVNVEAKIKFSLMDTIWVENIKFVEKLDAIQTNVPCINIKNALLEKQFGTLNYDAEEVLKEKATACGIFKNGFAGDTSTDLEVKDMHNNNHEDKSVEEGSVCSSVSSQELREQTSRKYFENCNTKISGKKKVQVKQSENVINQKKDNSVEQEIWENLLENMFSRVLVGAFYNPNNFYVQRLNDLDSKEKLYKAIDKFVEENFVAVIDPKIGLNCLAKYEDKYNRAKITKVVCDGKSNELIVSLFFCDIGISDTTNLSEILHSSEHLVNMIPFQAIRCKMIGVIPTTYGIWTEDTCNHIYDGVIDPAEFLYARPVRFESPIEEAHMKYWRCEVVLMDCSSEEDININERIVEMGLAQYDPETKHYLSIVANIPDHDSDDEKSEDLNWDNCNYINPKFLNFNPNSGLDDLDLDVDIQFSQDDILQLLNLPSTAKILPPERLKGKEVAAEVNGKKLDKNTSSINGEQEKKISLYYRNRTLDCNSNKTSSASSDSDRIQYKAMARLKTLHKSPQVFWQQSESLIFLQIAAPDVQEYYLKVSSKSLLFIANIESEVKLLVLNFCGCIDSSLVSHEIRGLKVIMRLPKAIKGLLWPRLTSDADKPSWLKYNYDSIIVEQETLLNTGRYGHGATLADSFSDTDSYTDEEDFNIPSNDIFDPFDDEFTFS